MSVALSFELAGRLARLTLSRPEAKNALRPAEWQQFASHLREIQQRPDVRTVLVCGSGGAFSSGGDLKTMPERLALPIAVRREQLVRDGQVIRTIYELDVPVVASIPGVCMGAGLSLALACDLRICSEAATFGAVFHRVGLSADFGLSWLLPQAVGASKAMHMLMTAQVLSAQQAQLAGIVHDVVPAAELETATMKLCEQLASGPKTAQAVTKQALHRSASADLATMLEWEAHSQSLLSKTADTAEGVSAFIEKRSAVFRGE
ncbi:MAG: enoyl-CoA hydratase/isomerase family protein [Myxococcales bacterium]|nr:enoyl-CoA hydratase/isomerase family protein [Myxococcales bacterium]